MSGEKIGYIRVSSYDQKIKRQLENVSLDKVFTETASAKNTNRPQLQSLLNYIRFNDIVIVHSLDRLARNLNDLRNIVNIITNKGAIIKFLKESLIFTGNDSPMENLLLSIMGAFAEFERSMILERQREGIELAKKKGIYKGRKKIFTDKQIQSLVMQSNTGKKKSTLAKEFGVSRETIYRYLRMYKKVYK